MVTANGERSKVLIIMSS